MTKQNILKIGMCLIMALYELPLMAQGVIVYKKDGTEVTYPYETIDSIVTYNFNENVDNGNNSNVYGRTVDLGLPSGTLWADRNIGADSPEGYGDYFAWGETNPKSVYDWSTYKYCKGSYDTLTKYNYKSSYGTVDNKTILEASDDAATVNWGNSWRMPTYEEQQELIGKCTWTWTTSNGVKGYKVVGPNGNSIFLPAAGHREDSSVDGTGSYGLCWSASHDESFYPTDAWVMNFYSGGRNSHNNSRYCGYSVRAVARKN